MLRARGPDIVLLTSLALEPGRITMLAQGPDGAWAVETPHLPVVLNGCGDVTAALFLARLLRGESLPEALAKTAAAIFAVIETTARLGRVRAGPRRRAGRAGRAVAPVYFAASVI